MPNIDNESVNLEKEDDEVTARNLGAEWRSKAEEATEFLEATDPNTALDIQEQIQAAQAASVNNIGNQINQAGANLYNQGAAALQNAGQNPQVQAVMQQYGMQPPPPSQPNFVSETGAAIAGGAADAVESVGGFAELAGDTIKTGINSLFGSVDNTQNPFSDQYISGDAGWLDIPDHLVPENKTALGKLARGLVEFGLLTAATGGVGGATLGGARVGLRVAATARAAGIGAKGTRYIRFLSKAGAVAAEGGAAELISDTSEDANLMNLVDETTPWMTPWLKNVIGVNALKVNPEDNPWLARIKTVATGAGINLVGWGISAYAKGRWSAFEARKQGKTIDEANDIGNARMEEDLQLSLELDERAATEKAADQWHQGAGVSHANSRELYIRKYLSQTEYEEYVRPSSIDDMSASARKAELEDIADGRGQAKNDVFDWEDGSSTAQQLENQTRKPDPWVNPDKFNDSEKALTRPDSKTPVTQNLKESVIDMKNGGKGRTSSPILTDAALKKMSRGDANIAQYIKEVAQDISREAFKDIDNTLGYKEVQELIIKQASEMHEALALGGNPADNLRRYFKESPDFNIFNVAGTEIVTGTVAERGALQLVINTLAKQAETIALGAVHQATDISIGRQVEQVFDAMKVAITEHKKIGYMIGSGLADMKGYVLSPARRTRINRKLALITQEQDEYFEALHKLNKQGRSQEMKDLMELHALSDGNVRTLEHIHEWLQAKLFGGDMGIKPIKGKIRQELQGVFYNSILSSLKTPIDAVVSTVMIGASRPMMQYIGAAIKLNKKEMAIAAAGIDAIHKSWAESIDMAMHNWDLGLQRKNMSYQGRYDVAGDIAEWQSLKIHYEKYGTEAQKMAYGALDVAVNLNTSPWMKYSANAMGAGDAFTRTMLGRANMRMEAAREAVEKGIDLNDVGSYAKKYEQNFRDKIFKLNGEDKYIVSDLATKLAGDEATMTKALQGWPKIFEEVQQVPIMRAFFPFVRTGVNAVDLTFQSSPLAFFHKKYRDLSNMRHLDEYGLRPEQVAGELSMMQGRIAVGSSIIGLSLWATASGNMTGDYPYDKKGRELWKANGIQPYSFKLGDKWVSYKELEPWNTIFSVASNAAYHADILGEDLLENWTDKAVYMAAAVLVDKSMLSGVKDLTTLFTPSRAEGQATKAFSKYARSHLPYAGLLGQIGNITDANAKEAQTFMELLAKRDVYWKSKLPNKYDILSEDRSGKPLNLAAEAPIYRIFNAFSPIAVVPSGTNRVKQVLSEMQYNLPDEVASYKGVMLNSAQRSAFQRELSKGPLYKELAYLFKNRRWQRDFEAYKEGGYQSSKGHKLSEQKFYQQVYYIFQRAKARAWRDMLAANPELANEVASRRIQKVNARQGRRIDIDKIKQFGY